MPAVQETVARVKEIDVDKYKYGFTTEIESVKAPKGLNEDVVRFISAKKGEPDWLLAWRLEAYRRWLTLEEPTWANVHYPKIDFQDLYYYAAPKSTEGPKSLDEVDPELLRTYERLGIPLSSRRCSRASRARGSRAGRRRCRVRLRLRRDDLQGRAGQGRRDLLLGVGGGEDPSGACAQVSRLGRAPSPTISTPRSIRRCSPTASFVYVPPGVRCPMELSTYFRINEKQTGQFERTLIIADKGSYVSYLEGCTAPMRDENQLHAAVVELVALDDAEIKYSTVQNWYPGDKQGKGGIYNFVTKRGDCRGPRSKISWTQVETGSAITWKYPSCILRGDGSRGEFYSIAISNGYQQVDSGTKMIHLGREHVEPHHLQGHRRRPLQQHLSRAGLGASPRRERAQLHQLRLAADRRQMRRAYRALYRGEERERHVRARGDHLEDLRRPAVLLPEPRAVGGGGGGADRQRLRARRAAAAADGVHGRDAEADRHQPGGLGRLSCALVLCAEEIGKESAVPRN